MLHNHPVAELQAREENVSVIDEVCVCMCACVYVCACVCGCEWVGGWLGECC